MRLLVYGGTKYAERRRIGTWSDSISGQILQSTEGLSERRPVYGVGLFDHQPFLIFRLMVTHGRSYPLTILLDPGPMWPDFGWNGPLLLTLLFDHFSDVGSVFFKEPENLNSVADIEERLLEVKEAGKELIRESVKSLEEVDENLVCLLTAGSTLDYPRIIGGSASVGFLKRPSYGEMAELVGGLPLPLRSSVGWVMGGTLSYGSTFNTTLIFDENEAGDASNEAVNLRLLAQGREWLSAWKNVEVNASVLGDALLNDLMNLPLADWERVNARAYPQYTRTDLFNDISCLSGLLGSSSKFPANSSEEVTERFNAFLHGKTDGPLNKIIESLFNKRMKGSTGQLNPAETVLVLRKIYEHRHSNFQLGEYESRLDTNTAIQFLAERRIYPSEQSVPIGIDVELMERLFSTETDRDLPLKVIAELNHLKDLPDVEKERLVRAAVNRTATQPRGLAVWARYLRDSAYGTAIQVATEEAALEALNCQAEGWQESFFLFVAERQPTQFRNQNPKVVTGLIQYALQQRTRRTLSDDDVELREKARAWLAEIGGADIRDELDLTEKTRVARADIENWEGLRGLDMAFNYASGEAGMLKPSQTHPTEQRFLVSELKQFIAGTDLVARPPNLQLVHDQFSFAGAGQELEDFFRALEPLLEIQPDLNSDYAMGWVGGSQSIAKLAKRFAQNKFVEKFHGEAVRCLLESPADSKTKWPFALSDLVDGDIANDHLRELFVNLLFRGDHSKDAAYARRLLDFSTEIRKKLLPVLQETIVREIEDDQSCRTFFRRFGDQRKCLELLISALNEEQAIRLDERKCELRDQLISEHEAEITKLFSGEADDGDCAEQFVNRLQASVRNGSVDNLAFSAALNRSFQSLSPDARRVFMSRFAHVEGALSEVKGRLTDDQQPVLAGSIAEYESDQLSRRIESLLSRDDEGALLDLSVALTRERANPKLSDATSAAVRRRLDVESSRDTFYNRFLLTKNGDRLRIKKTDGLKHLNLLFANLKPPIQKQLLEFVFRKDPEAFHRMVNRGFQELKNDRAYRRVENEYFKWAVFAFLWTRSGKTARLQLLAGTADNSDLVLELLAYYQSQAREMEPEAEWDHSDAKPRELKRGIVGWFFK